MSSPNSPGDEKVAGAPEVPATDSVAAEIAAEIADHLATTAEQLESQGVDRTKAQAKSQAQFGDAAAIGRRCYWIKQGDTLMFRWAIIVLLLALSVGLGITTLGSWRSQQQMAEQMAVLTEQLKAISERDSAPQTRSAPVEPAALQIRGNLYIGSRDQPAAYHEVKVCKAIDGEIIRRLPTSKDGSFSSGPLPAGDYFLLSAEASESPSVEVQSAPILLYPGTPTPQVNLDVSFPMGRLAMEFSRPLPTFEVNGSHLECRVILKVLKPRSRSEQWTSASHAPPAWPVFISRVSIPNAKEAASYPRLWFYEVLSNEMLADQLQGTLFLGDQGRLPTEECVVSAQVLIRPAWITPPTSDAKGEKGPRERTNEDLTGARQPAGDAKGEKDPRSGLGRLRHPYDRAVSTFNSFGPYALRTPDGAASEEHRWARTYFDLLRHQNGLTRENRSVEQLFEYTQAFSRIDGDGASHVPISAGRATRLRIEIPDDLESRIQKASDETLANPERVSEAWKDNPLLREAKITVVGTEPLKEKVSQSAASNSPQ